MSQCLSCCLSICKPFLLKNVPRFCAFLSLWMYPIQNRFKLAMVKIKRHSNLTEIWCHGWMLPSKYYMLAQQFWKQRPSKRRSFLYTSVCLKCGKMVRDDNFKKERMLRAMGLRRKGYLGGRNSSNIAIIIFCTSSQTHFIGATSIGPGKYHYDPWLNVSSKKILQLFSF